MKRIFTWCLCLALAILCVAPAAAAVNDSSLPRIIDEGGWIDDEQEEALAALSAENAETYGVDCAVFILASLPEGFDGSITDYNDAVYRDYAYGCGDDRAFVLLTLDTDQMLFTVNTYRGAGTAVSDEQREALSDKFIENVNGGAMSFEDAVRAFLLDAAVTVSAADWTDTSANTAAKPDWYPADVKAFTDFHNDASVSRVVDNADIFTPAQEAEMAEKIAAIQQTYNYDFVVYTDDTSYGLDRGICAADFYQFNGYGYGSDYSGGVLFICMEPGNRGWWTAARGGYRNLFTEENCNAIDDRLEPYMVKGDYGDGVLGYLDDTSELMRTGKVPKTLHFGLPIAAGIVAFLLGGTITTAILRSGMKTVRHADQAHEYLVDRSFHLRRSNDFYLHSSVTRTKRVKEERSGGGGSSYSGGYSSSGGGSFSGGGRSF